MAKKKKLKLNDRQKALIATMPEEFTLTITDSDGNVVDEYTAMPRGFSSGSVGYYFMGQFSQKDNPKNKFKLGANLTLSGSKPEFPEEPEYEEDGDE